MKDFITYRRLLSMGLLVIIGLANYEPAFSQTDDRTIKVQATGEVEIPADQILFSIQIRLQGDSPDKIFRQHRDRESYLAKLIRESGIKDSQLSFQPVRISKVDRHRPDDSPDKTEYHTHQQVRLRLSDFALFDTMQVKLIDHGFDTFSARFKSSKTSNGQQKALDRALDKARSNAQQIADQMDLKLGPVKQINYSSGSDDGPVYRAADAMEHSSESMMDFPQTLTVTQSVEVIYYIKRK